MRSLEDRLNTYGFFIYDLPNGQFAVADPSDNDQGFYVESKNREEVIAEGIDHITDSFFSGEV